MTETIHKHTGLDQPQINPADLEGFPIFTTVPTHTAEEGTIILYDDEGSPTRTYRLYARLNQDWRMLGELAV